MASVTKKPAAKKAAKKKAAVKKAAARNGNAPRGSSDKSREESAIIPPIDEGNGGEDESVQQVQGERESAWAEVLPDLSQRVHAVLAAEIPSIDPRAASEIDLQELRKRLQTQGKDPAAAVRAVWGPEGGDASRGLQQAAEGDVDVPTVPPESSQYVTRDQLADIVKGAVGDALRTVMAAQSDALSHPAPGADGKRDPGMMTTENGQPQAPEHEAHEYTDDELEILELHDPIAAQIARAGKQHVPGGHRVEANDDLHTRPLSKEDIEQMSEAEIDEYNANEVRKMRARKQSQLIKRSQLEKMGRKDRLKAVMGERDPSRIREADNLLNEQMVKCLSIRRVGLGEEGTSDVNEYILLPVSGARRLQESGAIRVAI